MSTHRKKTEPVLGVSRNESLQPSLFGLPDEAASGPGFTTPDDSESSHIAPHRELKCLRPRGISDAAHVTDFEIKKMASMVSDGIDWRVIRGFWSGTFDAASADIERALQAGSDGRNSKRNAAVVGRLTSMLMFELILDDQENVLEYRKLIRAMVDDMFVAAARTNLSRPNHVGEESMHRLRSALSSGEAYVGATHGDGVPVVAGDRGDLPTANTANRNLGWHVSDSTGDPPQPRGIRIGVLVHDEKRGNEPVVVIKQKVALNLVRGDERNAHATAASIWRGVWEAGFCYDGSWGRRYRGGKRDYLIRPMFDGVTHEGVPFALAELAAIGDAGVAALDVRTEARK